eukprot:TRINITY_DN7856_c0_g1_i6.p1 TRINITY_DN7856_c0_g1~~TRINITY_DN7856_c0_g1_i6.p1  ORF type:complete len:960 (+),score=357.84 TRINITY_DN7856_c0_g1_i6:128-2881(+)
MAAATKKKTLDEFFVTEVAVKLWIERVLSIRLPNNFLPSLKDGVILCRLMLELRERSIPQIYGYEPSSSSSSSAETSSSSSSSSSGGAAEELPFYLIKNNIQFFLAACEEEFNLSKHLVFGVFDLYRLQNEARVVYALKNLSDRLVTDSSWTGPVVNEKLPADQVEALKYVTPERQRSLTVQIGQLADTSTQVTQFIRTKDRRLTMTKKTFILDTLTDYEKRRVTPYVIAFQSLLRCRIAQTQLRSRVRKQAYRSRVAQEIIETEISYVRSLIALKDIYLDGLTKNFPQLPLATLYNSLTIILNYSTLILKDLSARFAAWGYSQVLGDIFNRLGDFLKVYTQYVREYDSVLDVLIKARSDDKNYLDFINNLEEEGKVGQPFESCLIMPVQRIPRYEMLLKELLKNTEPDHPDHPNLTSAYAKISQVCTFVNQAQRNFHAISKLLHFESRLKEQLAQHNLNLIASHRRFVLEGNFVILPKRKRLSLLLFNDILLVVSSLNSRIKKPKLLDVIKLKSVVVVHSCEGTDISPTVSSADLSAVLPSRQHFFQLLSSTDQSTVLHATSTDLLLITSWATEIPKLQASLAESIESDDRANRINVESATSRASWKSGAVPADILKLLNGEEPDEPTAAVPAVVVPEKKEKEKEPKRKHKRRMSLSSASSLISKIKTSVTSSSSSDESNGSSVHSFVSPRGSKVDLAPTGKTDRSQSFSLALNEISTNLNPSSPRASFASAPKSTTINATPSGFGSSSSILSPRSSSSSSIISPRSSASDGTSSPRDSSPSASQFTFSSAQVAPRSGTVVPTMPRTQSVSSPPSPPGSLGFSPRGSSSSSVGVSAPSSSTPTTPPPVVPRSKSTLPSDSPRHYASALGTPTDTAEKAKIPKEKAPGATTKIKKPAPPPPPSRSSVILDVKPLNSE